jgi:Protein of unknown function (DUF2844)
MHQPTLRGRVRWVAAVLACLAMQGTRAAASLGGDAASVQDDRVHMQGALRQIVRGDAVTFHEMQSASGIVVREYMTSSGTVFGISWRGATFPDLRQLLGPYFERYQQEAERLSRTRKGHGPLTVDLGDVVVQSGGHPRSFFGRAYLTRALPAGITADVIR